MLRNHILAIAIFSGIAAISVPLEASTIVSITGNENPGSGLAVESGVQVVAQAWTTSTAYNDLNITADLSTVAPGGADVIAYLMTQIGPNTTTSSQVAFDPGTVISGSFPTTYTLFSGLTLPAGTYYLLLSTGTSSVANWAVPFPTSSALITTAPGAAYIGQFDACDQPFLTCNAYPPASTFRSGPNLPIFAVSTPEPSSGALAGFALLVFLSVGRAASILRR